MLESSPLPAPLHLLPSFLRFRHLSLTDKARAAYAMLAIYLTDRSKSSELDSISFYRWLKAHGQSERAIEVVKQAAEEHRPIDSLGPVVHNPQVVHRLAAKNIQVVKGLEEARNGTVVITAHGAGPQVVEEAAARGLRIVDATCPIVRKSQKVVQHLQEAGFQVIIYGDEAHPEVRAVLGWSNGCGCALEDAEAPVTIHRRKVALLSQTTKSEKSFTAFVAKFITKHIGRINELRVINTTCPETDERYHAARELAAESDLLIVVGGMNSANTQKLAETCAASGVETHHIETAAEIDPAWLAGKKAVGVTAGASTPDESIEAVMERLQRLTNHRRQAGPSHARNSRRDGQ